MRRRGQDETDEELEGEGELVGATAGDDLGSILSGVQDGAGNHALASLVAEVEAGDRPAEALLPGQGNAQEDETERERKGAADRATHMALSQRLASAKAHPHAERIEGELIAFGRRLKDAREYGWIGMDAGVLGSELDELEDKLRRAEEEDEASRALASVDFSRKPLSERTKKAIMERTAIMKPGMLLYAPEDFEALDGLHDRLAELQKRLIENGIAVTTSRQSLGELSGVATLYARTAAANLGQEVEKVAVVLEEIEAELAELSERHARANAEDREKLNQLMDGLEPRLRREPRLAMSGGGSRQEIDYLIKKAWLEQHEATQKIAKAELWQILTGFSPDDGRVCYFDLPEKMGDWRIHLSLDYGVMRAVDVDFSESEVRDAIMGAGAGVVWRSHATAEVLGRNDDRNPHFYYGTSRVTPKKDFWSTREGKAAKNNWRHYEGELIDAFDTKADELVALVDAVLEERRELKAVVVKVGESLQWAG
jgi:hypothetical protein